MLYDDDGMRRQLTLAVLAVALTLVGGSVWFAGLNRPARESPGVEFEGAFDLLAHDGRRVNHLSCDRRWLVVTFGFTSCTDACPVTLGKLTRALAALEPRADRFQPLFITLDPERDTPERLARWLAPFDSRFLGLRGDRDETSAATAAYRIYHRESIEHGTRAIEHSAFVYVVAPGGHLQAHFPEAVSSHEIVRLLNDLLSAEEGL